MTTQEMQQKLIEKQNKLSSIVGDKEAKRLMDRAIKLVVAGKKSISDLID